MSSKPRENKLFGRMPRDLGWDIPGVTGRFENKKFCVQFLASKHSKMTTDFAKSVELGHFGTNLVQVGPLRLVPPYDSCKFCKVWGLKSRVFLEQKRIRPNFP